MKKLIIYFVLVQILIAVQIGKAQKTLRVLFIGNSYTYSNSLPQLLADMALSTGDTILHDSYTPGGYTFQLHASDSNCINKIKQGNFDFVILQEQSQRPSFPLAQVTTLTFPYATMLDSIIKYHNPCAETMFFMTWGRKNGDASNCANWPPVCTYAGMDSLLRLRYMMMGTNNNAVVSPVGAVWNYIRATTSSIDLYSPDESHPSLQGTYAAACCFYATLLRKNPELINFNSQLVAADADSIRHVARLVAYDSLPQWYVGAYDVQAGFNYTANNNASVSFTNTSTFANQYLWNFGDGDTSSMISPNHAYNATGTYIVTLTASACNQQHAYSTAVSVINLFVNEVLQAHELTVHQNGDLISIQADKEIQRIRLYTISGELIWYTESTGNKLQQDVSHLTAGIYLIEAMIGGHIIHQKVLVR